MVSYASNVCGSISGGAEEESGKPPEQTVGLDREVLGKKWLCSVCISASEMVQPSRQGVFWSQLPSGKTSVYYRSGPAGPLLCSEPPDLWTW